MDRLPLRIVLFAFLLWCGNLFAAPQVPTVGEAPISVSPSGWTEFKTALLNGQGAPGSVALDIKLPVVQVDDYWHGQIQVFISVPSRSVYNVPLGAEELFGLQKGVWHKLNFFIPGYVQNQLRGAVYSDLQFSVVLNTPNNSNVHQLANLRFNGEGEVPLSVVAPVNPNLGTPAVVYDPSGGAIQLPVAPSDPNSPESIVRAFFRSYPAAYQLLDTELALHSIRQDAGEFESLGNTYVRLQQMYAGLLVFGAEAIGTVGSDMQLKSIQARLIPSPELDATPTLSEDAALVAFNNFLSSQNLSQGRSQYPQQVELGIYSPLILQNSGATALAYRVESAGFVGFVDAKSADILFYFDGVETALTLQTSDDENDATTAPKVIFNAVSDTCPSDADPEICALHQWIINSYNFFLSNFGRDGDTGSGAALIAEGNTTALGTAADNFGCPNATADMLFCTGTVSADVVAHEFTHRVTNNTAGLVYANESGALNESYSDVFAWLFDPANDFIGEGTVLEDPGPNGCGGLRSIRRPNECPIRSGANIILAQQPMVWQQLYTGAIDGGGVHINSGIPNFTAYLMSEGGRFFHQNIRGIGRRKLAMLYFNVLTTGLTTTSNMHDAAVATALKCQDFVRIGFENFTEDDCLQVNNALTATGMLGELRISSPLVGQNFPYGGIGTPVSTFKVDVVDRLGANTNQPEFSSPGLPPFSSIPTVVFPAILGGRDITAKFTFNNGFSATATIVIDVLNYPPEVSLAAPLNGQSLPLNQWVTLEGSVLDINSLTTDATVSYTSSNAADEFWGSNSAHNFVRFSSVGARILTLTATDPFGLTDSLSISVNVVGANQVPPVASILNIVNIPENKVLPVLCNNNGCNTGVRIGTPLSLVAGDSGAGASYEWFYESSASGNVTPLGTGQTIRWETGSVPTACGGVAGRIILRVSNSAGSSESSLNILLTDDVC